MVRRGTAIQALASAKAYLSQVRARSLRLRKDRVGSLYDLSPHGDFAIFRETVQTQCPNRPQHVVLVVGFRLKLLRSSRFGHWLFQRGCILTTPFWCGFKGFHTKLWMVDHKSYDYAGIYDWAGAAAARDYVRSLSKVLTPLSVAGSVWYKIIQTDFEDYLQSHALT